MKQFEDLECWRKAKDLSIVIYKIFWKSQDFWFKNQIERAAVSISNNIAEWYERQTNKELRQFLFIAKWSCWEVRSMLYIAKELWYIDEAIFQKLLWVCIEISKMLSGLIKTL
jgi:four helix bundle protein